MTRSPIGAGACGLALQLLLTEAASAAPVTWTANNHQYEAVLVPQGLGWIDADIAVEARGCGWHLATIGSEAENKFVFGLVKGRAEFFILGLGPWLGGYQKNSRREPGGDWAWVTGERFSYAAWATREPSNFADVLPTVQPGVTKGSYESFLAYKGNKGLWNDYHPHALLRGYIAEFDPAACPGR